MIYGCDFMSFLERINKIYKTSDEIIFDDNSKIVLMSDCHRGDGSWADTFSNNQNIYFSALYHYYYKNFTYIELGDGDELWENRKISDIIREHSDVFWLLSKFYSENRLYCIYGNHDMVKKDNKFIKNNLYKYFDERQNKEIPLFENIQIHEGLILKHKITNDKIFLVHGHQVEYLNNDLWIVARFLIRYFWRPLEIFGVTDITRTAKNYKKKYSIAKILSEWVKKEKHMLIAGHNHRPVFPEVGETPYFNDGSCVHPRCITAIEISEGFIKLVKWSEKADLDGKLYIAREILAGPRKINDYFNTLH
jgi:UDP-2,3-diacylglucosamine pyrophosphatase LpxH